MSESTFNYSSDSDDSFQEIHEQDVGSQAVMAEAQPAVPPADSSYPWRPNNIKLENEFIQSIYTAGRTVTIGIVGPNQSGKTQLINHLSSNTESHNGYKNRRNACNISPTNQITNYNLKRTVFPDSVRSICKISHNAATPSYSISFLDTPGHAQQITESIAMCLHLNTVICTINLCAGIQADHKHYIDALTQRKNNGNNIPRSILAFSNLDKFLYAETRNFPHNNVSECCQIKYLSLRLRWKILTTRTTFHRMASHTKYENRSFLDSQTLLCFYDCKGKYHVLNTRLANASDLSESPIFEDIVRCLLLDINFSENNTRLFITKSSYNDMSNHSKKVLLYCVPYNLNAKYNAFVFHTNAGLTDEEIRKFQELYPGILGPFIRNANGSLNMLSVIPRDTIFFVLVPMANTRRFLTTFGIMDLQSTEHPFQTHMKLPNYLIDDLLQLSVCFAGVYLKRTQRECIIEAKVRGEYILNLFLSIFYAFARDQFKDVDETIMVLPLLPTLTKIVSHTPLEVTQFKAHIDKLQGILDFSISLFLRQSPVPEAWGYKVGTYECTKLMETFNPDVSIYDQIATLYADKFYSIVDGTMQYSIAALGGRHVTLTSQLTHQEELVEALITVLNKELQTTLVPFHDLQIVIVGCNCYQEKCSFHPYVSRILASAMASSKILHIESFFFVQLFVNISNSHGSNKSPSLQTTMNKLHEMLQTRRCIFITEPWIELFYPISSLALACFYMPASSVIGLEIAIEKIVRCTSVNIYCVKQQTSTKLLDNEGIKEDTAATYGILNALKSRAISFGCDRTIHNTDYQMREHRVLPKSNIHNRLQ